ncbi:MAG: phosphate signaling complex PhoU family protein [Actinomycetota bacterium]
MNSPALAFSRSPLPQHELVTLTGRACVIAQECVSHAIDGLVNGSPAALANVRSREEKLDQLDREFDERLAAEITTVTPGEARELLASLKLMLDLERVGDLVASFAERSAIVRNRLDMEDVDQLTRMACTVENMLELISRAFSGRNVEQALHVLRRDAEVDRMRNLLLVRHTDDPEGLKGRESLHVLFMANALERAGDHIKNMAEEVCHVATGHTVRHLLRSKHKPVEQLFLDWLAKQNSSK